MIESIGTMMDVKWIAQGGLEEGAYCRIQGQFSTLTRQRARRTLTQLVGGVKQFGNVGNAIWYQQYYLLSD